MQELTKNEGVSSDERFVRYYEEESVSESAIARFSSIKRAVLRLRKNLELDDSVLDVADIGCNAGTQSMIWARDGHRVSGIDISNELVDIAGQRAEKENLHIQFSKGSATSLPWADGAFDVCIMPELLEHVDDWESCLNEACRVVKPGGIVYLSTTNVLCPVQQEFNLPGYSWYPNFLKRRYEKAAVTTRPDLVNFATFPAIHWFTFYQLRNYISQFDMVSLDRFQMIDDKGKGKVARLVIWVLRKSAIIRFFGHLATPYSVVFAYRPAADS